MSLKPKVPLSKNQQVIHTTLTQTHTQTHICIYIIFSELQVTK